MRASVLGETVATALWIALPMSRINSFLARTIPIPFRCATQANPMAGGADPPAVPPRARKQSTMLTAFMGAGKKDEGGAADDSAGGTAGNKRGMFKRELNNGVEKRESREERVEYCIIQ